MHRGRDLKSVDMLSQFSLVNYMKKVNIFSNLNFCTVLNRRSKEYTSAVSIEFKDRFLRYVHTAIFIKTCELYENSKER